MSKYCKSFLLCLCFISGAALLISNNQCYADSILTRVQFSQTPDQGTLESSQIIIRNTLLGVVKFNLNELEKLIRKINVDDNLDTVEEINLGSGTIYLSRGLANDVAVRKIQAAVSLKNSNHANYLRLRFTKHRHAGRVFEITYDFNSGTAKLRHVSLRALAQKTCALKSIASKVSSDENGSDSVSLRDTASALKTFTVATDCDRECYLALGQSSANDRIAEFFNSARSYYRKDFGFDLLINSQTVRTTTSSYGPELSDPSALLNRLYTVAASLPKADFKHLITAKEIKDDVVGLSYLSVVCSNPEYSLGFSQHFNSLLTPIIIAHEIGHNFGADHDPKNSEQGIMTTVLTSPYPKTFSAISKSIINEHINSLGNMACYDSDSNDTSPPSPSYDSILKTKFSRGKVSANISQTTGSNCSLELHAAGKESKLFTTSSLISSTNLSSASETKIVIPDMKKVLLANSSRSARAYLSVKSVCSEGTGYSDVKSLNVGAVKSTKINKSNTVRGVKEWINLLKTNSL